MSRAICFVFSICSTLFFTNLFLSPAYAIELSGSEKYQKIDVQYETIYSDSKDTLNTKIDNPEKYVDVKYHSSKLNMKRFKEAQALIEERLKQEDIGLPLVYDHLNPRDKVLATSVRNLSMMGLAVFAFLWALPEEATNWDADRSVDEVFDRWRENVAEGPIVDEDSWEVNYIGHPLSGAYEYLFLRNEGFSKLESFGFTIFVSTVMWEYGIESLAEVPSIQDLLITPLIGAVLGEYFHKWDEKLRLNDYKLLNSKRFGRIVHKLINPVEGVNKMFDKITSLKFLHLDKIEVFIKNGIPYQEELDNDFSSDKKSVGLRFKITF